MICNEGIQLRTSGSKALTGVGGFDYVQGEYGGTSVQGLFPAYLFSEICQSPRHYKYKLYYTYSIPHKACQEGIPIPNHSCHP